MPKSYSKSKKTPNWYVITGGPCSGKTTTINELAKLGYLTVPETARIYIEKELAKGRILEEIRKNEDKFQRKVLEMKIKIENKLPKEQIIFLDRAIPDSISYYQIYGLNLEEVIKVCEKGRYKKIFFLEQLPFEKDSARIEDGKTANKLSKFLKESYKNLGYEVIDIPAVSVEKRVQRILREIEKS